MSQGLYVLFLFQVADMQIELEELQPQLVQTAAENEKMLTVRCLYKRLRYLKTSYKLLFTLYCIVHF